MSRRVRATFVAVGLVLAMLAAGWGATALGRGHRAPAWSLSLLLSAGVACTAAGRKRLPNTTRSVVALWRRPVGPAGVAEQVGNAVPTDFRLHPAARVDGRAVPVPNVPRDGHTELVGWINEGGFILIQGDSAVGKSHLAYWAAREAVPAWSLLRCTTDAELAALGEKTLENALVVLDDLERFLTPAGLTESLLAKLRPRGAHVTVLATLRSDVRATLTAADEGASAATARILRLADHTVTLEARLSEAELSRARELASDSRIHTGMRANDAAGFGPTIAGGPAALARWELARAGGQPVAGALISAAVDLRRAGIDGLVPRPALEELWRHYLPAGVAASRSDLSTVEDALKWAAHSESGTEPCLRPHSGDRIAVFDYLVNHAWRERLSGLADPIRDEAWQAAIRFAQVERLNGIASAAILEAKSDVVESTYRHGADREDPDCLEGLGMIAATRGDHATAESFFRRAIDAGSTHAMLNLGSLLAEQDGCEQEAEALLRQAADGGESDDADYHLGMLLAGECGREEEAESVLRRLADNDHSGALISLGRLLGRQPGREAEAEAAFRRAIPLEDTDALDECLFMLFDLKQHRRSAAVALIRRLQASENSQNLAAIYGLARLLGQQEDRREEAKQLLRCSAELGDPAAAYDLGCMLLQEQPGRKAEAEAAFRTAAAGGIDDAVYNLGVLLGRGENLELEYGQDAEAEYRDAAATGDSRTALLLALLLADEPNREDEAEPFFRQAIPADDTGIEARYGLALLLLVQGGRDKELSTLIADLDPLDGQRADLLRELHALRDRAS